MLIKSLRSLAEALSSGNVSPSMVNERLGCSPLGGASWPPPLPPGLDPVVAVTPGSEGFRPICPVNILEVPPAVHRHRSQRKRSQWCPPSAKGIDHRPRRVRDRFDAPRN